MDAAVVGGLVGAVTQVLLTELYRSLTVQDQGSFVFKDEFNLMKEKLEYMISFLADAQQLGKSHRNYMTLQTTFTQLRELVYDADDIMLDFHNRAAYEDVFPIRRHTPRGRLFRHNAESTLKKIINRIDDMENKFTKYLSPLTQIILINKEESTTSVRPTSRILSLSKPVGLEDDTPEIVKWITTHEKSCRIALVGMGGLGKTTFARKIFNERDVVNHFDKRVWVTVSQAYKEEDILLNMLKHIRDNYNLNVAQYREENIFRNMPKKEVNSRVVADDVMSQICRSLTNQRYLIVMDDVWRMDGWWRKLIDRLPKGERCKSSIIITTRHERIARDMGVSQIHKVHKLDENESWSLFCSVAFSVNKSMGSDPEFEAVGKAIVKKCDGLPLAIKTIAGLLSTKLNSLHQWRKVCANFFGELENESTVLATLRLSYDDLPAVHKHCILCFSVYPEDMEINADQLVYWWVSEGFVQERKSYTAIDEAFQCLKELVNRCLVEAVEQRGYDGRVFKCKMHDVVRELIIKISKDEKFCSFDEASKQVPEVDSRHLGYTAEMDLERLKENSKLRAFLLMKYIPFTFHPALATVNSLRVVDLSNEELKKVHVKQMLRWIQSQKRLAYVNFQGVENLKKLPDWIKKRQNLKILVLKDCKNLKKLPPWIIYLQNLVLLDVENCPLEYLPHGFGKLTKLQVLYGLKLTKQGSGSTSLGELKSLINLRVLGINLSKNNEIPDKEEFILYALSRLKVLYIDSKNCEQNDVALINKLLPPASLEELHLSSYNGDTTPDWLSSLFLPELLYLSVEHSQIISVGPNFWNTVRKPWKLEGICLNNLPRFKLEWGDLRSMKYLRHVEVRRCQHLNTFPFIVNDHGYWERNDDNQ
ncbi:hypothetical protein ACHQM5_004198 [Ranunculus cassubicifolius]